ncbi:hypothetical protein AX16_009938, partial [Volvariella volvacea WC 439]
SVLDLALLPQLTCLALSFYEALSGRYAHLGWVVSQISWLPIQNNLKELQIWVGSYSIENDPRCLSQWGKCWEKLDKSHCHHKFNGLKEMYVDLSKAQGIGTFAGNLHTFMPNTKKRKSLFVIESLPHE